MRIKLGYELIYDCPHPLPMVLMLSVHESRRKDLASADQPIAIPAVPIRAYRDSFGNICHRLVAPVGRLTLSAEAVVSDTGKADEIALSAPQHRVEDLPDDALVFLLASRYCDTDRLMQEAWQQFEHAPMGWGRVQAICDFVHRRIVFNYEHASPHRTASEAFNERRGVCRDYAHLAIAMCRCMNIPARYCTGYLTDIGIPPPYGVMDFAAWFEAYLDGRWYTFDPRNNMARIGRILIARGRDAADVAITTTFGANTLTGFTVVADEIIPARSLQMEAGLVKAAQPLSAME